MMIKRLHTIEYQEEIKDQKLKKIEKNPPVAPRLKRRKTNEDFDSSSFSLSSSSPIILIEFDLVKEIEKKNINSGESLVLKSSSSSSLPLNLNLNLTTHYHSSDYHYHSHHHQQQQDHHYHYHYHYQSNLNQKQIMSSSSPTPISNNQSSSSTKTTTNSNLNLPSIILPQLNHYQPPDQTITFNQTKLNNQPQLNHHHQLHHHLHPEDLDLDLEDVIESEIVEDEDEDEEDDAQYAMAMDDPYAEVEHGWRRMSESAVSSSQKDPISVSKHQIKPINTWSTSLSNPNNEEVVNQLNGFSFSTRQSSKPNHSLNQSSLQSRKFSLPAPILSNHQNQSSGLFNLSMRRSDQPNSFKPPGSSTPNKTSFSNNELIINPPHRSRLPSFSTELEPISGSPTSPDSPMIVNSSSSSTSTFSTCTSNTTTHSIKSNRNQSLPPTESTFQRPPSSSSLSGLHQSSRTSNSWKSNSQDQSYSTFDPTSSSSSSLCSSSDEGLLRRASCSSLASVASLGSQNGSTSGLKARRGLTKPLSLAMPSSNLSTTAPTPLTGLNTRSHLHPSSNDKSNAFRSLPPSPRLATSDQSNIRDQIVGMRANVTGSLSMKRRTSIPRLSLGGLSHNTLSVDPNRRSSLAVTSSTDYVKLLGRNLERSSNSSVASTPLRLHFDPIAARDGRTELMSSQVGVGGRGHIERPQAGINGEPVEEYPYQNGPREVLPGIYLGSEQNARDVTLLNEIGFSCIINVAKEVECPWNLPSHQSPSLTPMPTNSGEMTSADTTPNQELTPVSLATPTPSQRLQVPNQQSNSRTFLVRPTASTPNLHRSYKKSPESNKLMNTGSTSTHHKKPSSTGNPVNDNGEIECEFPSDISTGRPSLEYHKLPWSHDQDGLAMGGKFDEIFEKIDQAIAKGKKILIHCQCGVSRSATLVIGYCMRESFLKRKSSGIGFHHSNANGNANGGNGGMHEAYTFVKEKSPWAGPNMGLIYQLIEYEKVLKKKITISSVGSGQMMIMNEQEEEEEEEEENDGARTPTGGAEQ